MDCFRINLNTIRNSCACHLQIIKRKSNTCFNNILSTKKIFHFNKLKLNFCFKNRKNKPHEYEYIKMTLTQRDFLTVKENFPDLDVEIRGILMSRAKEGATIEEIRSDYYNYTGTQFPSVEYPTDLLLSVPNVCCYTNTNGTRIFHVLPTEKTQHVYDMVLNQKSDQNINRCNNINKPTKPQNNYANNLQFYNNNNYNYKQIGRSDNGSIKSGYSRIDSEGYRETNCFYEDNYKYLLSRFNHQPQSPIKKRSAHLNYIEPPSVSSYNSSTIGTKHSQFSDSFLAESDYDAHLCDFQLMGDDFFLYMARMELKCKFKPNQKVLESGLCVSGMSICDAIERVYKAKYINKRIIINLGSVDIMQGSSLIQIEHNFLTLLKVLRDRNIKPILTTLVPLANLTHVPAIRSIWERFNDFIRRKSNNYCVVDLWSCMVNEHGKILFDCYQNEPRRVTGSKKPHVFWNNIGRQRVLKLIESELEY